MIQANKISVFHVMYIGRFLNYIFSKFWKPIVHFMGKIGLHHFKDTSLCVDKWWSKEKMHFENMSRGFGHNQ